MHLQDELFLMAGLSDRITATIARDLFPLIAISPEFVLEFLHNAYGDHPDETLSPAVLRPLEEMLTRSALQAIDPLEGNAERLLVGVGEVTRNHVVSGLEEEEFPTPTEDAQRKSGIGKIELAFAGAAGLLALRKIVNTPIESSASGEKHSWPQWFMKASADMTRETRRILRTARDERKAISAITAEMRQLRERGWQSVFTTTRSAVTFVANQTLLATYRESGVVSAVRYVAVLDNATSQICQGLSGTVWPVGSADIKAPPRHPNCRSILMAILKGQEDAPLPPSYEDWLRGKPTAMQKEILGRPGSPRSARGLA
jgi:SPP1 gp7 family putative phage head morphogenesis protein